VRLAILFTKTACDVLTLGDLNQPVSNRPGDRIEENRVHDADDGRRGSNAEREHEHSDGSEAGVLAQHPQAVASILSQLFDQRHTFDQCRTYPDTGMACRKAQFRVGSVGLATSAGFSTSLNNGSR
jgi:hypothetical protein